MMFTVAEGHICQRNALESLCKNLSKEDFQAAPRSANAMFEVAGNFVSSHRLVKVDLPPVVTISCQRPCFFSRFDDKDVFWLSDRDHFTVGGNASTSSRILFLKLE